MKTHTRIYINMHTLESEIPIVYVQDDEVWPERTGDKLRVVRTLSST